MNLLRELFAGLAWLLALGLTIATVANATEGLFDAAFTCAMSAAACWFTAWQVGNIGKGGK